MCVLNEYYFITIILHTYKNHILSGAHRSIRETPERYETWAKGPRCLNGGLFKDKDVSEPCV